MQRKEYDKHQVSCIKKDDGMYHATLMLADHYIGAPVVPLAEQYSFISEATDRLECCIRKHLWFRWNFIQIQI